MNTRNIQNRAGWAGAALAGILLLGSGPSASARKSDLAPYQPGTYEIDPMHSKVGFEVPHLVISSVEGTFGKFSGTITMGKTFRSSKVKAKVDIASIDTGVGKRDEHLRSKDFFDAKKYPTMQFVSTGIDGKPSDFRMRGKLTIKGKTRAVVFKGKYLGAVTDGYGQKKVAFSVKTKVSRKAFGLTWNQAVEAGPVVGDEITIELKVQGAKK